RYSRRKQDGADSTTHVWVRDAIESKGASQRIHRNTLIFLLADKGQLESLEAATRSYLGWKKVQATGDSLNLSTQQRNQTDDWVRRLDQTVSDRIRDTFIWAVYPEQFDPAKPFELVVDRVPDSSGRSLAERVSAKLAREDQLVTDFGAPILGATLHNELGAFWRDAGEISVGELWGYFTRYTYLPRLVRREVLDDAIQKAVTTVLVRGECFGIATSKDTESGRYRGLMVPPMDSASIQATDSTLLIDVEKANEQIDADNEAARAAAAQRTQAGATPVGPVDYARTGTSKPVAEDSDSQSSVESE